MVIPPGVDVKSLVFRSWSEIFVSKTENLQKRQQKAEKSWVVHYRTLRYILWNRPLKITEAPHPREDLTTSDAGDRHNRTLLCCSHSFASCRGFRKYPSVEDGKRKIKTPIRVSVAERRRRETVKRMPCIGVLPLASCCLYKPTELWERECVWSLAK